jgi:DNA-binding transcriptional MerR regulator
VKKTSESPVDGYSGKRAAEIVDISYRQLDYWARTDLIRPSLADAHGSGTRRRYSYRDLIELKLVKTLLDAGNRLETIRDAFQYIRDQLGEDLSSAKLVVAGNSVVLVRENDELVDVFAKHKGQGVLNFLDLEVVKEEVDSALVELFPEGGRAPRPSSRKLTASG